MKTIKYISLIALFLLPEVVLCQNRAIEFNGSETRRIGRMDGKELAGPRRDDLGDQIERFNLPYLNNAGLAWDGEFIWGTCRTAQRHLFCIDPEDFDVVERFDLNISDAIGMTWDPVDGVFWVCEYVAPDNPSFAHLYDQNGDHVGEVELPRGGHHGLACDGEFIYSNSEHNQENQMIYRLNRNGEVDAEGPNLAATINHGRAVSLEWIRAHEDGHFWVMSVGYISQVSVDFDEGEARVIREFRSENTDYPHQGLAHDGYDLWAGGRWSEQRGFVYDDGIEEVYGELELDRDFMEFGPVPSGEDSEQELCIYNRAEEEDELHRLDFTLTDLGEDPDWLELEPDSGQIEARDSVVVTFTAITEGLDLGEYERTVMTRTNDPDHREVEIQVHIFVVEGFGQLHGTVTDAADDAPVEGALVRVDHFGFTDTTDEEGAYTFPGIPAWTYGLVVTMEDYLPLWAREVEIGNEDDVTLDFALLHSEFDPDPQAVNENLQTDEALDAALTIRNDGNGPLTWTVERVFPEEAQFEPWEYRTGFTAGDSVDDNRLNGIEFDGEHFYVSGGNSGADENLIYLFDRDGNYQRSFPQFMESHNGMRDLAWDGQHLWGTDGSRVYQFTTDGELVSDFNGPIDPSRCIAWDPDRKLLWICDISSDIFGVTTEGEDVAEIDHPGCLHVYGLAWFPEDPDGYNLYLFCSDGEFDRQVNKVDVESGEWQFVADLAEADGRAGGLAITGQLDPYSWVYVGLLQGNPDAVGIWNIASRTDWLAVEPDSGVVEAESETELAIHLSSAGLPPENDFTADLRFTHDGVGGITEVPVRLAVTGEGGVMRRRLQLGLGWNLLSVNVEPAAESFPEVVQPLVDDGLLVLAKDGTGNFYWPAREFNNIERWAGVEGYLLKVLRRCELSVEGVAMPWDRAIPLSDGWNLVSYLPRQTVDAMVALSGLGEALVIAKDGRGRFYLPDWGFSDMGQMVEGQGYQLNVEGGQELIYQLDGGDGLFSSRYTPDQLAWISELLPAGSSYSLLLMADGLPSGSWVEAYTPSGVLAGRGVVGSDGMCGLTLWGNDPSTEAVEGFREGEALVVLMADRNVRAPLLIEWLEGNGTWQADGWGVARLEEASVPVEFGLYSVYPNPFNAQVWVRFGVDLSQRTTLKVFDLTGREVEILSDRTTGVGYHQVVWDASNLPSGLYIVRLESAGRVKTAKAALIR